MSKSFRRYLATVAVLSVTACGGGGGGGGETGTTPTVPTPVTDTTVTSVPAATYAVGSSEAATFALLNAERGRCGLGLLAQNTKLDVAAAAHAKYLTTNNVIGHDEVSTKPDFYESTASARGFKSGYGTGASEDVSGKVQHSHPGVTMLPQTDEAGAMYAVRQLLSGPYHGKDLTIGYRDVGMASFGIAFVAMPALASGQEMQHNNGDVRTYPCEGTTGTLSTSEGEIPSPFPSESNAKWGQPILVYGSADLAVSTATVTGPSGTVAIKAIFGKDVDPNGYFKAGSTGVAVIPAATMTPNTAYTVTIAGTNKGSAFTKSFSFTTGAY